MKTIIYLSLFFLSFSTQAQNFRLNSQASTLNWTGKAAFNTYALSGTLKAKFGKLRIEKDTIVELTLVIDMMSLDHENNDLKSHLRSKDFFNVKKFKEAQFLLSNNPLIKSEEAQIKGRLTIKDKSKQETILIAIVKIGNKMKFSFKTTLDRLDYGVTYNSPSLFKKLKQNAIADEFVLEGELIFDVL